jgi:hypothetical protein
MDIYADTVNSYAGLCFSDEHGKATMELRQPAIGRSIPSARR